MLARWCVHPGGATVLASDRPSGTSLRQAVVGPGERISEPHRRAAGALLISYWCCSIRG